MMNVNAINDFLCDADEEVRRPILIDGRTIATNGYALIVKKGVDDKLHYATYEAEKRLSKGIQRASSLWGAPVAHAVVDGTFLMKCLSAIDAQVGSVTITLSANNTHKLGVELFVNLTDDAAYIMPRDEDSGGTCKGEISKINFGTEFKDFGFGI